MHIEEKQALWFSKATRFGISVALISVTSMGLSEVIKRVPILQDRMTWLVGAIMLAGGMALIADFGRYKRKSTPEEILRFHHNPHYWGCVLVLISVITYALCSTVPVRAAVLPPPLVEAAPDPEPPFPDFTVSVVVVNGSASSARLNGTIVWLNESIQGVKLAGVSATNIIVELNGKQKTIPVSL